MKNLLVQLMLMDRQIINPVITSYILVQLWAVPLVYFVFNMNWNYTYSYIYHPTPFHDAYILAIVIVMFICYT